MAPLYYTTWYPISGIYILISAMVSISENQIRCLLKFCSPFCLQFIPTRFLGPTTPISFHKNIHHLPWKSIGMAAEQPLCSHRVSRIVRRIPRSGNDRSCGSRDGTGQTSSQVGRSDRKMFSVPHSQRGIFTTSTGIVLRRLIWKKGAVKNYMVFVNCFYWHRFGRNVRPLRNEYHKNNNNETLD